MFFGSPECVFGITTSVWAPCEGAGTLWQFIFGIDASYAMPHEVHHTADFQQDVH